MEQLNLLNIFLRVSETAIVTEKVALIFRTQSTWSANFSLAGNKLWSYSVLVTQSSYSPILRIEYLPSTPEEQIVLHIKAISHIKNVTMVPPSRR